MRLRNVTGKQLEGMYDGQIFTFQPGETRDINDPVAGAHLLMKLEIYGLVDLPFGADEKAIELREIQGLQNRRLMLDSRVRAWRTMNKEREAAKLSAMQPTRDLIETIKEIKEIDEKLSEIQKEDFDLVNSYMNEQEAKDAEKAIDKTDTQVETGTFSSDLKGDLSFADKKPKRLKNALAPSKNP